MYVTSPVIQNLENGALILKRCEHVDRMKGQDYRKNIPHSSPQGG
jgi:hypothetical protein